MVVCVLPCHVNTTCLGIVADEASATMGAVAMNNNAVIAMKTITKLIAPLTLNHLVLFSLFKAHASSILL